ncbi:MAG TPA: nuclear transport factor 2 family protein [Aliidongia sp.]|uniref:nuclear transport factor 2 family protein n=1 Tax=Aliidongia sp. TaxID=1914230 RepID=UPI002DDD0E30|nr:nuclear transport factor 2 family protein [Aliidongia sp.]HEV2674261.1 nuclear transport factor 2 family protein [Aliidongia sp.]
MNKVARTLETWHAIVAAGDVTALPSILSDAVVLRSPAFFKPYPGKEATVLVIGTVITVFEDFVYHRAFHSPDGQSAVLEFSARIGDKSLKGVDIFRFDDEGLILEIEVMIRPGNALMALGKTMAERAGPALLALLASSR